MLAAGRIFPPHPFARDRSADALSAYSAGYAIDMIDRYQVAVDVVPNLVPNREHGDDPSGR